MTVREVARLRVKTMEDVQRQLDIFADKLDELARARPKGFSARRAANAQTLISGSFTTLTFDTEEYDDDNCFNHSLGEYAAPESGWYAFAGEGRCPGLDAGENVRMALYVNGTAVRAGGTHQSGAANEAISGFVAAIIWLAKDDIVTLRLLHDEGADQTQTLGSQHNRFSGVCLGAR